jgi:ribosome-binding protein aMBF1 (putative translation factor)
MNSDAWRCTNETTSQFCEFCGRETTGDVYWDSVDKKSYNVCRECNTIESDHGHDSSY